MRSCRLLLTHRNLEDSSVSSISLTVMADVFSVRQKYALGADAECSFKFLHRYVDASPTGPLQCHSVAHRESCVVRPSRMDLDACGED
ncbi:hypothetical protein BDY19DRAFT_947119 [Irpex rosettiformis]|uniref:Uncharacterized protein n=1 Tax=Irpex rosettiformis TaxID=378272 RepID=A0ACB8U3X6_9APHY|nr:hypothetical protein BDY19DRAFT_947119 [Irpex rosettiformis]